ncbi:MAG: flagellar hook-associated protein FlgK [Deltaproteobacteria bacterium]|nr:flagellar hook-associated protein FlgK [Deltaproteobacteria bacterium]
MSGLSATLYTAGAALRAHQLGVQTAGANVANAATPGYSARQVILAANPQNGALSGVTVVSVSRKDEPFLRASSIRANVQNGYASARADLLSQMEGVLAPVDGSRVEHALESFFSSASALASDPSSVAARQTVLTQARAIAVAFNSTAADISALSSQVDARLSSATTHASDLARQLAELNQRVGSSAPSPDQPSSLLDERDRVAKELAGIVGGDVLTDKDGNVNIIALGTSIVAGKEALSLSTARNATSGKLDVVVTGYGKESAVVTARATQGEIGGLISVRDRDLMAQTNALDALAFDVQTAVNGVHQAGVGLDGASGRALFAGASSKAGAAAALRVDPTTAQSPRYVTAASSATTLPGDNRAALALAALYTQPAASSGTATFAEAERSRAGSVASAAQNANTDRDDAVAQSDLTASLLSSATGVSTDEEMIQLAQFQRAYQASAKVIATVNEMLDTLVKL